MSTYYENFIFDAIDETGKVYYFDKKPIDTGFELTLKKETLQGAKKIYLLPTLSKAKVGDEGFYITPRNLDMKGDIYTSFKDREDVKYIYNRPILSSYCIKTPNVCCLVRIKRISHYYLETIVKDGVYTLTPVFVFTENDDKYCQHEELAEDICLCLCCCLAVCSYCC
jgi:hypothetical protein